MKKKNKAGVSIDSSGIESYASGGAITSKISFVDDAVAGVLSPGEYVFSSKTLIALQATNLDTLNTLWGGKITGGTIKTSKLVDAGQIVFFAESQMAPAVTKPEQFVSVFWDEIHESGPPKSTREDTESSIWDE